MELQVSYGGQFLPDYDILVNVLHELMYDL